MLCSSNADSEEPRPAMVSRWSGVCKHKLEFKLTAAVARQSTHAVGDDTEPHAPYIRGPLHALRKAAEPHMGGAGAHGAAAAAYTRVCVKNVPKHVNEARLKEHFSAQGEVTDVKLLRTR